MGLCDGIRTGRKFHHWWSDQSERPWWPLCWIYCKSQRIGALKFGTTLNSLAGNASEMLVLAQVIRERCIATFGPLSYDKSTLPIRVIGNQERQVIELYLPQQAEILAANPEMWLALADVIETTVAELRRTS